VESSCLACSPYTVSSNSGGEPPFKRKATCLRTAPCLTSWSAEFCRDFFFELAIVTRSRVERQAGWPALVSAYPEWPGKNIARHCGPRKPSEQEGLECARDDLERGRPASAGLGRPHSKPKAGGQVGGGQGRVGRQGVEGRTASSVYAAPQRVGPPPPPPPPPP
jgi:hypothetical protein